MRIKAGSAMCRVARLLQPRKAWRRSQLCWTSSISTSCDRRDVFGGRENKTGPQVYTGQPNKKAAKGLVTDLYVANKHHEATQVEIFQQMGNKETIVATESPPSPPAVDVNPTSPTPPSEQVDDDPIGLTIIFDSGYEPIVSKTLQNL